MQQPAPAGVARYLSPASFWLPEQLVPSAWLGHAPFAFWLTDALRPRRIVELGTRDGFSYLAFCQAARRAGLDASLTAIQLEADDGEGDARSEPARRDLAAHHDPRYGAFSRLSRGRPDAAADGFEPGSVDLLHLDARHRHGDVKAAYEAWAPKLSDRAVVLFHGTGVREGDAGVWRLWGELSGRHPSFAFLHGRGLGVLGVGRALPEALLAFFAAGSDDATTLRETYHRLGSAVEDRHTVETLARPPATPPAAARVVPAAKPAAPPLHVHLAAMAPLFLDVRTRLPLDGLSKLPGVAVSLSEKKVELPRLPVDQPKVLVLQRAGMGDLDRWRGAVAEVERRGWVLVCELDDHPDLFAAVHKRAVDGTAWRSPSLCHAVQTSTPAMAEAIRPHNPHVAVFPNCAFTLRKGAKAPSADGTVRVFYGALNRENFSRRVAAALAPFAAGHPEVEFVVVHDRAFFDALGPCRKLFHPAQGYEGYLRLMAGCDVALMPLEGGPGERFKSDVKWVEASGLGLATVASPVVYADTIRDGIDGLIAAEMADWPRHLASLVGQRGMLAGVAAAAHGEVAARRTFATQAPARLDWYRGLWDRRADLVAEAQDRRASSM